jgi:8-oxo-dGTP pyrophosphatase MutT (NUDIX family)
MRTENLPSPFYRVTAKALIFDEQRRLLVGSSEKGWQVPGGGWEHDESFEQALQREFEEEFGVAISGIGSVQFVYRGKSSHGWYTVRIAVTATIASHEFTCGDGLTEARFVTRDEFLALTFSPSEEAVQEHVDQIWDAQPTE